MPLCVFDIFPDGSVTEPTDTGLTGGGTYRWWHFDLSDPDFRDWANDKLASIPAAALMQDETRPRCDRFENGLILNLRGVNMNTGQPAEQMVSLRIWATQKVLITARVRKVFAAEEIRQQIMQGHPPATVAGFIETLVTKLTARVQEEVMDIAEAANDCEDEIADHADSIPDVLPELRRMVIKLRRYLEPQRSALQKLAISDQDWITDGDRLKLREQANRSTLAVEELDALRDRLSSVQDHFDTHASQRQGRNSYALSIVAAVFLPLGFLTGLFGVNVAGMPGTQNPWSFAILAFCMLLTAVIMYIFMRWMKWL